MRVHLRNNENNNRIFLCPNAVNTLIMLRHKILNGMTLKYIIQLHWIQCSGLSWNVNFYRGRMTLNTNSFFFLSNEFWCDFYCVLFCQENKVNVLCVWPLYCIALHCFGWERVESTRILSLEGSVFCFVNQSCWYCLFVVCLIYLFK